MPNFHRFTIKAQEALQNAQEIAAGKNHGELKALHLLMALMNDESSLVVPLIIRAGVNVDLLREDIDEAIEHLPKLTNMTNVSQLYLSQELMRILDQAAKIAAQQKDEFVSCEHLLLAILEVPSTASHIVERAGLRRDAALKILNQLRGASRVVDETPKSNSQVLKKYAINIWKKARKGELDPVIGREEELHRLMQVFSRRTKNNPVLIGEP